jgi:N6-adenosine-specific RNA methylase IME4
MPEDKLPLPDPQIFREDRVRALLTKDARLAANTARKADAVAAVARRALGQTEEARPYVKEALRCRWTFSQVSGPNAGQQAGPGRGVKHFRDESVSDDGLTDLQRHHWRKLHPLTEEQLEAAMAAAKDLPTFLELQMAAARLRVPADVETPPLPEPADPAGRYSCIVADPPWPMKRLHRQLFPGTGDTLDYPVMTVDDIAALPVADVAAEDAHLYLWTTHRFLPDALEIADAWGFRYQCLMTWVKPEGMVPYSWMYSTEHALFCRRGSLPLDRVGMRLHFDAQPRGHSVKPDVFYDRVLQASPGPRLEMFSRQKRDGFDAWGAEARD